jgi:hypothetical protein
MAGNGGKMAKGQTKLRTVKAKVKTGGTTTNKPRKRASQENAASKDGAELLRQEADKQVGMNSEKLVKLLTTKALEGDLASTRVLVGLAERKKPQPQRAAKKRSGPSSAELLEAEPEWREPSEEKEETGGEGVEAEG